jgi:hypothetical protein
MRLLTRLCTKSRPVSFAASPPSVLKGCAFPQSRTFTSFEAICLVQRPRQIASI